MKRFNIKDSGERGWFIGDFDLAVYRTKDFEVNYQVNERRQTATHVHKIVAEINLVISGSLVANGEQFGPGEICMFEPGDICQLEYLEDTTTVTIKVPSVPTDKHYL